MATSYATSADSSRRSLVQDLKYRFRIKAAMKQEVFEPISVFQSSNHCITNSSKVTIEDVRNIWIYRLISETGLPSYKVDIPREIVYDMERVLKDKMPVDEDGCILYENFLPVLVNLIRIEVTPEEEEEMVNELFEFWCENLQDRDIDALRVKAYNLVRNARTHNT